MRLSSVTLQGFKSFGHRTTVELSEGITAIVGPNGSGKSNLLDALKWVTGGGRAREFRAESRTDLIFHGAEGKRGVGYAEVEVELRNAERSIKIRRDLDRDGQSRLRLDGRAARFIDIDEALAGSGLGTQGVAMIGQGEIAGVLLGDPASILRYVAEAAGVARLSGRREQTQARLETARGHLQRLEDVVAELRLRIEQLSGEAVAAARFEELQREALVLRVTAGHARVVALESEVAGLHGAVGASEQATLEGRERLREVRQQLELTRQERQGLEAAYRDALAAHERALGAVALAQASVDRALEQRQSTRAAAERTAAEADELARTAPPVDPKVDTAALGEALAAATAERERAATERDEREAQLRERRGELEAMRAQERELLTAWTRYEGEVQALEQEAERVANERLALERDADAARLEQLSTELEAARARWVELEADQAKVQSELQQAHEAHAAAHGEQIAAERHLKSTRQAFELRSGYAQGPRVALTSGIDGVIGSVADLVQVDAEHQEAIAGALGRRSEYVVVRDTEAAQAVLAAVREAGGWVTLLPLDLVRPPSGAKQLPEEAIGWATDLVQADAAYRPLMASLLHQTAVVRDLDAATRIAKRQADRPRLVTSRGDVLESGGAISGGRRSGGATVLGLGRELERAEAELTRCEEATEQALAHRQSCVERVTALQQELKAARGELDRCEGLHRAEQARVAEWGRRETQLNDREARLADARGSLAAPPQPVDTERIDALVRAAEEAAEEQSELRRRSEEALRAEEQALRALEVGGERLMGYASAKRAYEAALARSAQLAEEAERLFAAAAGLDAEHAEALARLASAQSEVPDDLEAKRGAFERADSRLREGELELRRVTEEQARAGDRLEQARVALARREAALELALDERAALPPGVEPLEMAERSARSKLREIELELEALGPVNHRAALDYATQRDRLVELESEGAEAAAAVEELSATLDAIDRETNGRLNTALAAAQRLFAEHVRQLFGPSAVGGIEVEREGERPVGLRIKLQPPGKRTESLGLLSVGERTMGALAFLFALMSGEAGSLPIAVLDEVDAPLDEVNIRRFCGFIEALSAQGTQFVLITHQKATFETADTLWGVTSDAGVSRVFSMKREVAAARRPGAEAAAL